MTNKLLIPVLDKHDVICFTDLDDTLFSSLSRFNELKRALKPDEIVGGKGVSLGQRTLKTMLNQFYCIPITARDYNNFLEDIEVYDFVKANLALINFGAVKLIPSNNESFSVDKAYQQDLKDTFETKTGVSISAALSEITSKLKSLFIDSNMKVSMKTEEFDGETYHCYVKLKMADYRGERIYVRNIDCPYVHNLITLLKIENALVGNSIKVLETKNGLVFIPFVNTKEYAVENIINDIQKIKPDTVTFSAGNDVSDLPFMILTDYMILANETKPKAKKWLQDKLESIKN